MRIVVKCVGQRGIGLYLKRLEILGFKSFADKIQLEFMPGITAVVGPNGSGKSNISDALRWVLGEQSIKNLRGSKMDDVIFAGSEMRKPLGLAEVTIVLDNSDRSIPIDFSEICVTRKLFRSGESEFLINKSPVRLRDIHELFYDTGIGKEAYSVIGQGKIDSILSAKAEERRLIFEEAAGIIKYKTRKHIAERKLEDTDKNLVRLRDILTELEGQLGPLKTQAALAEEYIRLKARLTTLELNHFGLVLGELEHKAGELIRTKGELEQRFQDFEGQENVMDSAGEELRLELLAKDEAINQLNEEFYRVQNRIDKYREQIHFTREKLADIAAQDDESIQAAEASRKRRSELLLQQDSITDNYSDIQSRLGQEQTELTELLNVLSAHNTELAKVEDEEQQLKDDVIEILNEIASLKNKSNSASLQRDFITKQIGDCEKKLTDLSRQVNQLEEEGRQKAEQFAAIGEEITRQHLLQTDLARKIIDAENEQTAIDAKNRDWKELIRGLDGKISLLDEMEKSYQGYFQGVKALMAEASGESFFKDIHGIVADLIKVQPGMELAIETALGSSLQNIVIENDHQAQAAIAYLKKTGKGRATFLPLNLVQASDGKLGPYQSLLQQYTVQPALNLLQFESKYRSVLAYLLGQTLVAPDLKTAVAISTKLDKSIRIVTPEGDQVTPGGAMTGGSVDKRRLGLLSRRREIDELKKEKAEAQAFLEKGIQAAIHAKELIQTFSGELDAAKKAENEIHVRKITLEREIQSIKQNIDRVSHDAEAYRLQLNDLNEEREQYTTGSEELDKLLGEKEQTLQEVQARLNEVSIRLKDLKAKKEDLQNSLTELKASVSAAEQEQHGKMALKDQLSKQVAELDRMLDGLSQKMDQLKTETEKNQFAIVEFEERITAESAQLATQETLINQAKAERDEIQLKMKDLEGKQRSFRRKSNEMQNQLHRYDLSLNQTVLQMENIRQNLNEDYGAEWESQLAPGWEEPTDAPLQIERLKNGLKELGPVNLAAIEDYAQIQERYEFLSSQSGDLIKAREALEKVIHEIERTIVKRFADSMEQVRLHFRRIFGELFEGGNADLFLIDPDHPLESGVEIIAQPPGKKLQSLSLLSGGERAMTAIALLFSILAVKPSPFCILDEIDATLDEVNVSRFSKLLEIFSRDLQFVVVTHRRGTMESANTLYGVTMEEMGVSKLVSLDLNKKAG